MLKRPGVGLLLVTGLASAASAQGPAAFDGQYVGELTLKEVINGDCTKPPLGALYPLTISQGEVRFDYRPHFDATLRGRVDQNGFFKASARVRKGFVRMTGRVHGPNVIADIVSPSCSYSFRTGK
jgi:hypothetical protein